jgi:16S rRNA pseudouridine516 synthase
VLRLGAARLGGWNPQTSDWEKVLDSTQVDPEGLRFRVQGVEWEYHELGYVLLNKPAGTECSQKPSAYPSIYTLLPAPLRQRPNKGAVQGVQAVGRLDQDTTGMLLLSDDGQFIHRMSSPKKHVSRFTG